ncbi:MAG: hypothetical protein JW946_00540 [Candidatus Omnitrophica bacterium]|nr:hypothetical protein [Candidatus Omnitrophota bacterium]
MKKCYLLHIILIVIFCVFHLPSLSAEQNNPYISQNLESERGIVFNKDKTDSGREQANIKRNAFLETGRGVYKKAGTEFYFSGLCFDLGSVVSEDAVLDEESRPVKCSQIISDLQNPGISQKRLLSNIEYNEADRPVRYKEQIFIIARDYLSDSVIRLLSCVDVNEVKYDTEGRPVVILGNTEIVISDDKGNSLLRITGSFTKKARLNKEGKIVRYDRYGIDNIVVADGAGEIIITAPPSVTDKDAAREYRVGIVNIKDEQRLREIFKNQSFIAQLLAKLKLAELFYKAFYSDRRASLTYLQIENTTQEIMSLQNITAAFKNLIEERQKAFAIFQNDVDAYYENMGKTLFEHIGAWWNKDIKPQDYYAGEDKILSKSEYRKMIDDAIISLSLKSHMSVSAAAISGQILALEQYLRIQMLINSKLIYIQNLKDAVFGASREISFAVKTINRPVIIKEKGSIEALIALPEKKSK